MYDRFIVGVDDSDDARSAAQTAFQLAVELDRPVDIVHVMPRSVLDVLRSAEDRERILAQRTELLDTIAETAAERDLDVSTAVLEGKPAVELGAYAAERPGSILVIGRQGRSAVSEAFLGGVTEKVLATGSVPVLVDPGEQESPGIEHGPVLVPTDGSENAENAYPYAGRLAASRQVPIHLLSVLDLQRAGGVFDAGGIATEFTDHLEAEFESELVAAKEELADLAPDQEIYTALRKRADFDGVAGEIIDYSNENRIRCVVMGSHGRSNVRRQLLGSVTSTVLRDIGIPVLVVPRALEPPSEPLLKE